MSEHVLPLTDIVSWMAHSTMIFMNSSCEVKNPCDFHLTIYKLEAYPFLIENLRVIPTNSISTTLRRISRELYHPGLKVQRHEEEQSSVGTLH